MKTPRDYIRLITTDKSNLQHITNTGIINGSLLIGIETIMKEYAKEVSREVLKNAAENAKVDMVYEQKGNDPRPLSNWVVDNEDFERVKDINWHFENGYAYNNTVGMMHRLIMNCPDDKIVDHIYHDTLDNRKSNLRVCTRQQNSMNQKTQKVCKTSKYKGVFWEKSRNKWQSVIKKDGKRFYIGRYNSEEEAARAYNRRAVEMFGEFSKLNVL